ncbi:MAG: hypothetical protein IT305_00580 [Chloroflexi bacterium]|nr:hypothetical protein [Chloroflexota bacterium]
MTRPRACLKNLYRHLALLGVCLLAVAACNAPPAERPREGAPPVAGGTPVRLAPVAPPTLAPAAGLLQPAVGSPEPSPSAAASPSPSAAASPVPSPGLYPVITSIQPSPGSSLPPGGVLIGARVTATSDLVDVVAFLDGEPLQIELGETSARIKAFSLVRDLNPGSHEVRVQARDDQGQLGGYRWQFTVTPRSGGPGAAPSPRPTFAYPTPLPLPTRRSIVPPATPGPPAIPSPRPGNRF